MLLSGLYQSTRTVLQNHTVTFISRIPLIVADVLLILITWTRLNRRDALRGMRQSRRLSLSEILFRDGTFDTIHVLLVCRQTCPTGTIYFVYVR